jgi:hypothetical protein
LKAKINLTRISTQLFLPERVISETLASIQHLKRNKHIESGILVCYSNRSLLEVMHLGKLFTLFAFRKALQHIGIGFLTDFFLRLSFDKTD